MKNLTFNVTQMTFWTFRKKIHCLKRKSEALTKDPICHILNLLLTHIKGLPHYKSLNQFLKSFPEKASLPRYLPGGGAELSLPWTPAPFHPGCANNEKKQDVKI